MDPLTTLAAEWRRSAEVLRQHGHEATAHVCELHASQLLNALAESEDELLSPADAAAYAGVRERTLRNWKADGKLKNYGTDTRPLYRRGDLPHAPATPDTFDARAAAARLAS